MTHSHADTLLEVCVWVTGRGRLPVQCALTMGISCWEDRRGTGSPWCLQTRCFTVCLTKGCCVALECLRVDTGGLFSSGEITLKLNPLLVWSLLPFCSKELAIPCRISPDLADYVRTADPVACALSFQVRGCTCTCPILASATSCVASSLYRR